MVSVQARLEQARYAVRRGLSQRKSCALLNISRTPWHYDRKMPMKDAPVIKAMKLLSGQFPRFGARRIRILLARKGIIMGKERCSRIWANSGLQVPKKRRKKMTGRINRAMTPVAPNRVWSYDFVHDVCANGQKIKCLTVIDEFTRECLALEVAGSIRSNRVIEVLTRLMSLHGVPQYLRSDNGPEFVSTVLLNWVNNVKLDLLLIEPGKPWQNGANESFNGKFRDECLSAEWFRNRLEAKVVIEDWRQHYNGERPHSSLQYKTPNEFKLSLGMKLINGAEISRCKWL